MTEFSYSMTQLAEIVKGQAQITSDNNQVLHVFVDSRQSAPPATSLFVALKGDRHNGHKFITELYNRGFRNFLVEETAPDLPDANFVIVENCHQALQQLAAHHRVHFNYPVIGITGSNGKTTVKEWLFNLLAPEFSIVRNPRSYNSQVGVPLSVMRMNSSHQLGIFEAGMSMKGEIEKLENILKPKFGLFTNIGQAHQENFESFEEKANEKAKLFVGCEKLLYSLDDEYVSQALKTNQAQHITWSKSGEADLTITSIESHGLSTDIEGRYNGETLTISIPFVGDAYIENAILCWLFMLSEGYSNPVIASRMETLPPVAMRMEILKGSSNTTLINDTYNSDTGSLAIALDMMRQQKQHKRKTAIISDILQSGKADQELYQEVANLLELNQVGQLIGIGLRISSHKDLFKEGSEFYNATEDFMAALTPGRFKDEAILLKGTRTFRFERICRRLQQKMHRTVLEINLNSLVHNLNYFRSQLNTDTKIMVMTKAFGYGSGSQEIANILEFSRVDYLAVAYADEGIELRRSGITTPIMVMSPEPQSFDAIIRYELQPEIFNLSTLKSFSNALSEHGIDSFPVHVKIDSGMHRLGFMPDEITDLIGQLKKHSRLNVVSIFTHLAASDDPQHDEFTQGQVAQYKEAAERIKQELGISPIMHALNSSGSMRFPEYQLDMVRLGIGVYGISGDPAVQQKLEPVISLKASVLQVKTAQKGDSIGYSRSKMVDAPTKVAVLSVGYADGLDKRLGNGVGEVYIGGKKASIVGEVCMDMCMANVTGLDVREGDDVEIFGNNVAINDLAARIKTIPYEILTGISHRVRRVYFQE